MYLKRIFILTFSLLLFSCNSVFAISINNNPPGSDVQTNNVVPVLNLDDSLKNLTYTISSTGASAGIRYRTSVIKVKFGKYVANINTLALIKDIKPAAGQTIYSTITVSREDIIACVGENHRAELEELFKDPAENMTIGATIQIYNTSTGTILANLNNPSDCDIAYNYGFGSKDVQDMKSRFQDGVGVNGPALPDTNSNVRPSVLVR